MLNKRDEKILKILNSNYTVALTAILLIGLFALWIRAGYKSRDAFFSQCFDDGFTKTECTAIWRKD